MPAQFVSVTDGDTIRVNVNGREEPVRLILIDTPETHDPHDPAECFGQEATAFAEWLYALGGQMYLASDVSNRDRYDRLLRYVWLDFGEGEVYLANEVMVRSGYAALYPYPPDVKYVDEIRDAQRFARDHGYGLWSSCTTDANGDTNELAPSQPVVPPPQAPVASNPSGESHCDPSYADVCVPSPPPALDCGDIVARRFTVLSPDPHRFDGDFDGVGCERGSSASSGGEHAYLCGRACLPGSVTAECVPARHDVLGGGREPLSTPLPLGRPELRPRRCSAHPRTPYRMHRHR